MFELQKRSGDVIAPKQKKRSRRTWLKLLLATVDCIGKLLPNDAEANSNFFIGTRRRQKIIRRANGDEEIINEESRGIHHKGGGRW